MTTAATLTYDLSGNLATSDSGTGPQACSYDAEQRRRERPLAAGGSETYTYDAQGTLVRRTSHDGSSTVYVGGMYEEDFSAAGVVTGVTKYYAIGGQTVAVRQAPDATGTQPGTLLYLLHDHLGGTVGLLDTAGAVVGTQTYWPYGATRTSTGVLASAPPATDKQFTGQRIEPGDQTLGLYNYRARFYSTVLGEFLSADTTSDGLNRYSYVHDNPLRYTDPTGETCAPAMPGLGGVGDPGDCYDAPAPDPGLLALYDAGLTSPAAVQQALAVAACAANGPACAAWAAGANGGDSGSGGSSIVPVVATVAGVGLATTCDVLSDGFCAPADPAIAAGVAAGIAGCIEYCDDAGRALRHGFDKGWNTFFGKKSRPGELGIPGATTARGGRIKLPDGTYLEPNTNQQGPKQAHQGEEYEQQDYRNQRHRGVRVVDGRVVPVEGSGGEWKDGRVSKP